VTSPPRRRPVFVGLAFVGLAFVGLAFVGLAEASARLRTLRERPRP